MNLVSKFDTITLISGGGIKFLRHFYSLGMQFFRPIELRIHNVFPSVQTAKWHCSFRMCSCCLSPPLRWSAFLVRLTQCCIGNTAVIKKTCSSCHNFPPNVLSLMVFGNVQVFFLVSRYLCSKLQSSSFSVQLSCEYTMCFPQCRQQNDIALLKCALAVCPHHWGEVLFSFDWLNVALETLQLLKKLAALAIIFHPIFYRWWFLVMYKFSSWSHVICVQSSKQLGLLMTPFHWMVFHVRLFYILSGQSTTSFFCERVN